MKEFAMWQRPQLQTAVGEASEPNLKMKCISVMVFEDKGKTVFQPLMTKQEAETLQELFHNNILEIWLSNGQPDPAQFDVKILKYKQLLQPSTMCARIKTCVCLKNYFETIVTCKQCLLSTSGGKEQMTENNDSDIPFLSPVGEAARYWLVV